jgi:hypothetical protein
MVSCDVFEETTFFKSANLGTLLRGKPVLRNHICNDLHNLPEPELHEKDSAPQY